MAQFIQIPNNKNDSEKPEKILRRCYKNFNSDSFTQDINNIDWPNLIKENDNPNLSTARLIKFLTIYLISMHHSNIFLKNNLSHMVSLG